MRWRSANDVLAEEIERDNAETAHRNEREMVRVRQRAEMEMARRVIRTKQILRGYGSPSERDRRNDHILELWQMGFDRREIAELVDLTPQRISQIVNSFGR